MPAQARKLNVSNHFLRANLAIQKRRTNYTVPHMETLNSAIEWFIGHCTNHRKLSSHTLKAYRHDLKIFSDFMSRESGQNGEVTIPIIDKKSVQNWMGNMRNVKPRTIRRRLAEIPR